MRKERRYIRLGPLQVDLLNEVVTKNGSRIRVSSKAGTLLGSNCLSFSPQRGLPGSTPPQILVSLCGIAVVVPFRAFLLPGPPSELPCPQPSLFVNQMNNERETSGISLHDFNDIEGHRSRGFLNVKEKENSSPLSACIKEWRHGRPAHNKSQKDEMTVTIVTSVTEEEVSN